MRRLLACALTVAWLALPAEAAILDEVKGRGVLICGIYPNYPGFSSLNPDGEYVGFDIDFCRAVAAAVEVDLKFVPLTGTERFVALAGKTVDMLSMLVTWTASRDISNAVQYTVTNFYDGQGFMTRKANGLTSAKELSGATICIPQGTTAELTTADWFRTHGLELNAVTYANVDELIRAYEAGRCDAYTAGIATLASRRSALQNPDDHVILPEVISKEPLTPAVPEGDPKWLDIVSWTIWATMIAEEKGITQDNVEEMAKTSEDPEVQRLLGQSGSIGEEMGLDNEWAIRVIREVGNYEEIFERNVGKDGVLKLDRGLAAQWSDGGLLHAPPFR
jgi:general L-amino acid transport system substrate-binding protein